MTNYEAISAAVYPYDVDCRLINKSCVDNNIDPDAEYWGEDRKSIALAAISILRALVSLSSESNGGFSLSYDADMLKERIVGIAKENGFADIAEEFDNRPQITFLDW